MFLGDMSGIKQSKSVIDEVELSIDETNKLREKLGLKPLKHEGHGVIHADPRNIKKKDERGRPAPAGAGSVYFSKM